MNAATLVAVGAAVAVGAVAAAVVVAVVRVRRRAEAHLLASRQSVQLVPTTAFDPGPAEVLQVASLLAAIRPAVSMAPRRAAPLRVRLVSRPGSRIAVELGVPANALSLVQQGSYANVEHRRVPHATPAGAPVDDRLDPLAVRLWKPDGGDG